MSANPWMKFYPTNWRADPALRMCSIAARGLWMEMLCVMHEATPRGDLLNNGQAVTEKQLAALASVSPGEVAELLSELETAGVFSRRDNGVIYSRRMERETKRSEEGKEFGVLGGNPNLINKDKGEGCETLKGRDNPYMASGSSISVLEEKKEVSVVPRAKPNRGTRLSRDWQPSPANIEYARQHGVPEPRIAIEGEKMRNHFVGAPGQKGVKLDWDATWENWILRTCEREGFAPVNEAARREAVVFIPTHDARWVTLAERFLRENGKAPPQMAGVGGSGRHFPQSWVDDCLDIPTSLKRSEEAA